MVSPPGEAVNSAVAWTRNILLVNNSITLIYDRFETDGHHTCEILFHFPPSEIITNEEKKAICIGSEEKLILMPATPDSIKNLSLIEGTISIKGVTVKAPYASFFAEFNGTYHSVFVIVPVKEMNDSISIDKLVSESGTGIEFRNSAGNKIHFLFREEKAASVSFFGRSTTRDFELFLP